MKDKVLKIISDNSVPKHFCEYGEGVFADVNAVDTIAEEIVKLFSIPIEEAVFKKKFPEEEFDIDDYYEWVAENEGEAYKLVIEVIKEK